MSKSSISPDEFVKIARRSETVNDLMRETGLSRGAAWNRIVRYRRAGIVGFDQFRHDKWKIAQLANGLKIAELSRDAEEKEIDITDENY
jgi:hypothetical protein